MIDCFLGFIRNLHQALLTQFEHLFLLSFLFISHFEIQHKALGNAALQAGNFTTAIEEYNTAIRLDGSNHVYFSNRSAAYLSKGDAHNALEDATACLGLKPDFIKGYSRKGAALMVLKRYNDSMAAYQQGLLLAPNDPGLTKGLAEAQRDKEGPAWGSPSGGSSGGMNGLFGPQMMAQMAMNPKLKPYMDDPEVMAKLKAVQANPALLQTFIQQDPKIMELFSIMMANNEDDKQPPKAAAPKKADPIPEPVEDWSGLSPAERAVKEQQKEATAKKQEGNAFYKAKNFEQAVAAYDEAIVLDPTNMTYHSNKAAVFFAQKRYDDCIATCITAVQVGEQHRASFEDRAKALSRIARAYQKLGNLAQAVEYCKKAQLESFDKDTQRLLKTLELEKRKAETLAYLDDTKAQEAKQRGNDHFRAQQWPDAVHEYEEAVKRAPKDAPIRNNLAAALCKVMDFSGAQRQIEEALVVDPNYVKAYARKGDIEMYMKEYHKAQVSYKKGLDLEPDHVACKEGLRKCMAQITYGRSTMSESDKKEQAAHAMADPEIQGILSDPVMQQLLKDFSENPAAAQQAMKNPGVRATIEKLIAAGVIETG
jgi:stress-induced-phosphoprotein 1